MRRALVGLVALLALTGCTASVSGRATMAAPQLCPAVGQDATKVVACLADDLNRFWRAEVGRAVRVGVTVDPPAATVNKACRSFLAFGTAFYCPADARAYVTGASVARTRAAFGDRLPYALAAVVAHEAGHRVQYVVRQPGLDLNGDAASRAVEQQADCLAGVWAYGAARRGLLDPAGFRSAYAEEMQLVSELKPPAGAGLDDYDEVATHGTPAQRVAAFDRGDSAATNPCRLRGS
jgi:predicted metalloprotease